jgi:hypothetical protein
MARSNKLQKPPRFYFWRKTLSLSDLNLPRRSKITVDALRTLSLLPSIFGWAYNWKQALQVPLRDAGGAVILQCSQLDYVVASFWVKDNKRKKMLLTLENSVLWQVIGIGY